MSRVERGRLGLLRVFSRVAPRVGFAGALSSPSRWGWRLFHRRECPAVSGEFARDGDDDDRAGLAAGLECMPASVQAPTAAFSLGSQSEGLAVTSAFERDAPPVRRAMVPGGLDQQPAHVAVAGLGDRALAAPLPRSSFRSG